MQGRKALASALAVGMAIGPAAAAAVTLGVLVSPAVAQGRHHGHSHHAMTTSTTNTRTITLHGVITGTPTATSLAIARFGHGRNSCLTTPKTETVILDSNTTFTTQSNANAAYSDLTSGDAVTVTLTVPHGTAPLTVAATSVADLGTPPPVTCSVRALATSGVTGTSFTAAVTTGTKRHGHGHGNRNGSRRGASTTTTTSVTVNFDTNTVFVDPGNPSATIQNIAQGDRLVIVWSALPGSGLPSTLTATKVVDLGPPPPIRYRAEGVAGNDASLAGVSLTVNELHPNFPPTFVDGSVLPVQFNGSTVFVDPANPTATLANIAQGDRLIVVWSAAPGTAAVNLPAATRVYDLGP